MAVALRVAGTVGSPCVLSSLSGRQLQTSCPSVHTLRFSGKNVVKRVQSLQAIRLPSLQLSVLDSVFAACRSVSVQASSSSSSSSSSSYSPSSSSSSSSYSPSDATINPKPPTVAFKHVLLPVIDRNPYLSDATRQTIATTTALAKQYGADVTVVVIDHQASEETRDTQESKEKHELQLETIRWHLSEGGCEEYTLTEKVGEKQKPTAIIGEMADDLGLDLVVISMESIHHKHVDGNLLGEFVPCPILMLPL